MRLRISHKLTLALAEEAHQAQATAEATYRADTMAVAANASSAPGQPAS